MNKADKRAFIFLLDFSNAGKHQPRRTHGQGPNRYDRLHAQQPKMETVIHPK